MNAVSKHTTPDVAYQMLRAAKTPPVAYIRVDSRQEDKFVLRSSIEMQAALDELAKSSQRSLNSEAVMAILDALGENVASLVELEAMRAYLGPDMTRQVMDLVPVFKPQFDHTPFTYVIRLPEGVRDMVRRVALEREDGAPTMRGWVMDAMVQWINSRRRLAALSRAAVVLMQGGWVDYESTPTDGTTV